MGKPRLRPVTGTKCWWTCSDGKVAGLGESPADAYWSWCTNKQAMISFSASEDENEHRYYFTRQGRVLEARAG